MVPIDGDVAGVVGHVRGRPAEEPFGVGRFAVQAAMRLGDAEVVVPIGRVQRGANLSGGLVRPCRRGASPSIENIKPSELLECETKPYL